MANLQTRRWRRTPGLSMEAEAASGIGIAAQREAIQAAATDQLGPRAAEW